MLDMVTNCNRTIAPLAGLAVLIALALAGTVASTAPGGAAQLRLARFRADVTPPLGHRLMGVLPVKAREVVDPLEARGLVLLGSGAPIVLVAVDWCEIRNDAYERWRQALADAAGTSRERVLVSSIHQHDAPVADLGAERLLAGVGLAGELCDIAFHERAVAGVARALRESLAGARRVTHVGVGRARVERIASNRRVVSADGRVGFHRGSASGGDPAMRDAPEGLVDPWLRTVSFWDGEAPLLALHGYATHPMSFYGRGGVSADFPGMARRRMEALHPGVFQIYVSGASGDVTAGKYNDGAPENRAALAGRLHDAMERAWKATRRVPLGEVAFRSAPLSLPFHEGEPFEAPPLERALRDDAAPVRERILAAMGLASRERLRRPIDVACVDLGAVLIVLLPGESFVGYQLMAGALRPDVEVLAIGYGECWPGYLPTRAAFEDGFGESWRWVGRGAEARMREVLWSVLPGGRAAAARARDGAASPEGPGSGDDITRDVFESTETHPRYSEGSVIELAGGALLFAVTEFAGSASDFAVARIVARESADGGRTWGEPRVLQENVGDLNVMSVSLLRFRAAGRPAIGLFYLVKNAFDDLHVFMRVSTDEARTFGEPARVTDAPGYHVMNNDRVVELLDGRFLCPVASTRDVREENHFVSRCWLSDDGGETWRAGRGRVDLPRRGAMEPEVVELRDGRLLMIVRTQLGDIRAATSTDRGDTWSEPRPWGVPSPEAPATLRRIPATGDLLLVWNPVHVPGAGHGGPRTPLAAAVSRDEGTTWLARRLLETRADRTYAYASLAFTRGRALMTYYLCDEASGRISSRFRSVPLEWFYEAE